MVSFLDAHPEAIDSATILDIVNASTNGAVTPFFQMTVKHLMFGHFTTLNFSSPLIAAPSMIPGLSGFNATYDKDSLPTILVLQCVARLIYVFHHTEK